MRGFVDAVTVLRNNVDLREALGNLDLILLFLEEIADGGSVNKVYKCLKAIIKAPKTLLLDEATSALDSESERVVQEALDRGVLVRTTIVMAYRLSTICNADLITVYEDSQVMEIGSHEDFIKNGGGLYTSLVHLHQTENNPSSITQLSITDNDVIHSTSSRRLSIVGGSISTNSDAPSRGTETQTMSRDHQVIKTPSFWRLLAMNMPEWKQAVIGCVSTILFDVIQLVYTFAMGSMISFFLFRIIV